MLDFSWPFSVVRVFGAIVLEAVFGRRCLRSSPVPSPVPTSPSGKSTLRQFTTAVKGLGTSCGRCSRYSCGSFVFLQVVVELIDASKDEEEEFEGKDCVASLQEIIVQYTSLYATEVELWDLWRFIIITHPPQNQCVPRAKLKEDIKGCLAKTSAIFQPSAKR